MDLKNGLSTEDGWVLSEKAVDVSELVDSGSRFLVGNGYFGYRGTCCDWSANEYVACIVTNTWDRAEGETLTELCNVPNPLHTFLRSEGERLDSLKTDGENIKTSRSLDVRTGLFSRVSEFEKEKVTFREERFASPDPVHAIFSRFEITAHEEREFSFYSGIDINLWSLTGEHYRDHRMFQEGEMLGVRSATQEHGIKIYVVESMAMKGVDDAEVTVEYHSDMILRKMKFTLAAGQTASFEKIATIYSSKDVSRPRKAAIALNLELQEVGYTEAREKTKAFWEDKWAAFDVKIKGNLEDQMITRFNTYQSFIATPIHEPLPVGARGLSCQVYQGASFWDAEIFNLPMFIYTYPEIAKTMLEYRYKTLDGARRKAARLGFQGAFFAWASGETGDELFPDRFFSDLFSKRPFRNYFNTWQIHVSPDIAFAVQKYFNVTNDIDFLVKFGAELVFEIARFIASRVTYRYDRDRTEILRVIGCDEYHENVDNNAFTNYMSRQALLVAAEFFELLETEYPEELQGIVDAIDLDGKERLLWSDIAESLYLPEPDEDTALIEQFEGYFDLEDTTPAELRTRLLDPGEYWGFPVGVAVHTQVLKQADVVQLLALFDDFPEEVYRSNYEYYEKRTEHGSSLSPAMHAIAACRAGEMDESYRYFREGACIDFYGKSVKRKSGGKFLGGIHTAASGAVWLIVVEGFAGLSFRGEVVNLSPKVPAAWDGYDFSVKIHNNPLHVEVDRTSVKVRLDSAADSSLDLSLYEKTVTLAPGEDHVIQVELEVAD